jgi:hypothetical protein
VAGEAVTAVHIASFESWIYGPDDLSPTLQKLLEEAGREASISLLFEDLGDDRFRLIEGREFLAMAAKSWLRDGA